MSSPFIQRLTNTEISYIINELAEEREMYFNAITPPIIQTSNFIFKTVAGLRKALEDEMSSFLYSRGLNPTVEILRKKLAALDGAEDCLVFNSGAAAIFAGVLANVESGDHIISVRKPYTWAQRLFDVILPRYDINTTYVDGRDIKNFEDALLPNTSFIYLESPNSWTYELQDLEALATLAKKQKIITMIDNSYCTPIYQRPIDMGIDLCMQTATKYIGGHSDTLGGVLTGKKELMRKIFNNEYLAIGSGIQPFNAWLLIRGLRTLPARLERVTQTTQQVFSFLKQHSKIDHVIYPMDKHFPQYELAKRQMKNASGLLTFTLKEGTEEKIIRFCESLHNFLIAVSWGGHESLILPKCASLQLQKFEQGNIEHQYIRLYTGLEDPACLIRDLSQALDKIG